MRIPAALISVPAVLVLLLSAGCVNVDPDTGKTIPRGDQRFEFETVTHRAKDLEMGMTKMEVLLLLGSPAEESHAGDVWVYLPERPAVLIPGRALRLEFDDARLVDHGYRPIVLGEDF